MRRRANQAFLRYLSWNTPEGDLKKETQKCLEILSAYLEKSSYFFGEKVCSGDAVAFGYLASALYLQLPDNFLSEQIQKFPLLVSFVDRILDQHLGKHFFFICLFVCLFLFFACCSQHLHLSGVEKLPFPVKYPTEVNTSFVLSTSKHLPTLVNYGIYAVIGAGMAMLFVNAYRESKQ
jgi:hypothetical protein